MSDILIVISFLLSTLFSVIGVARSEYQWVLVGAIVLVPVSFSLMSAETLRMVILLPLLQVGSIFALGKNNKPLAWLLLLPSILATIFFMFLFLLFEFFMIEGAVY